MEAGVDAQASYKFAVKAKALEGQQISFSEDGTGARAMSAGNGSVSPG